MTTKARKRNRSREKETAAEIESAVAENNQLIVSKLRDLADAIERGEAFPLNASKSYDGLSHELRVEYGMKTPPFEVFTRKSVNFTHE